MGQHIAAEENGKVETECFIRVVKLLLAGYYIVKTIG